MTTIVLGAKAGKDVLQAAEQADKFLTKLAGGTGDVSSTVRGDKRLVRRALKQVELLQKAEADLRSKGVDPRIVKRNVVFPLLEAASLEDDPDMSERWAALLANAADPDADEVPPSFPDILRVLSPLEAQLLDGFYEEIGTADTSTRGRPALLIPGPSHGPSRSASAEDVALDNLIRQRLITPAEREFDIEAEPDLESSRISAGTYLMYSRDDLVITALGAAFVRACRREPANPMAGQGEPGTSGGGT